MIAPPGTALIMEPGGLDAPHDELSGASPAQSEQPSNLSQEQNRVIVHRRTSAQVVGMLARKGTAPAVGVVPLDEEGNRQQKQKVLVVRPSYSAIRTNIIRLTPESMKCKLYCRGMKCIYCNPENWTEQQQAIRGLYSNWINDDIMAMARPTSRTFEEFDLISQLKKARIRTVLNLQCVKEHDFCGPSLNLHTGFSYDPEILMRDKFYYFNFAIPDFGTTPVKSVCDICKVIWFALRYGRVAVHCHAGLGRTGTLIACFLVWSKGMFASDAIDLVRTARPNSIQSMEQINVVEEFAYHVQRFGTALPSAFYANNGISLRQLMANQRQFLPSDEARRYTHLPKVLFKLGDHLLRMVFEQDGMQYVRPDGAHHARSCTFGTICVNWRMAFTPRGKLQVRQIVNLFARITAFPYEKDQALISQFQQLSLVTVDAAIGDLDIPQLVTLLNAFLESIKRPFCSRRALIEALGHFSPDNPTVMPAEDQEDEAETGMGMRMGHEDVELIRMLMNPGANDHDQCEIITGRREEAQQNDEKQELKDALGELQAKEERTVEIAENESHEVEAEQLEEQQPEEAEVAEIGKTPAEQEVEAVPAGEPSAGDDASGESMSHGAQGDEFTVEKCAENYGGASLEIGAENDLPSTSDPVLAQQQPSSSSETATVTRPVTLEGLRPVTVCSSASVADTVEQQSTTLLLHQFDHHDFHTNKDANLSADWQCIVFYVCNVISYLTGENYDTMVDLLTFWFTGDNNRDVKQAIYCHMRDLFARNMRQQEQQAADWRRRLGLAPNPKR